MGLSQANAIKIFLSPQDLSIGLFEKVGIGHGVNFAHRTTGFIYSTLAVYLNRDQAAERAGEILEISMARGLEVDANSGTLRPPADRLTSELISKVVKDLKRSGHVETHRYALART